MFNGGEVLFGPQPDIKIDSNYAIFQSSKTAMQYTTLNIRYMMALVKTKTKKKINKRPIDLRLFIRLEKNVTIYNDEIIP